MSPDFISALAARRNSIEQHWRTLLTVEPVSGPLASPEALQYLIPEEFTDILTRTSNLRKTLSLATARTELPACNCGNNPYRAFYIAAEQAFTEAAVLAQAEQSTAERRASDIAALIYAVRTRTRSQIDTFCGACVHHGKAKNCRFLGSDDGGTEGASRARSTVGASAS